MAESLTDRMRAEQREREAKSTKREQYIEGWRRFYAPKVVSGEVTQYNVNVNIDGLGSWTTDAIIERSKMLGIEPVVPATNNDLVRGGQPDLPLESGMHVFHAAYNGSDPNPLLNLCMGCHRPRDNHHQILCPICLQQQKEADMIPSCPDCGNPLPPNGTPHNHSDDPENVGPDPADSYNNPEPDDPDNQP